MAGPSTSTASGGRCSAKVLAFPGLRYPRHTHPGADCCRLLRHPGLVHGLWHNIPHEFDDYIANPRENGYRSLHRRGGGSRGQGAGSADPHPPDARGGGVGVCAHWRYKGTDASNRPASTYEEKSPGCGRCWTGTRRPAIPRTSPSSSVSRWPRTGCTCLPCRATW